MVQVDHIVPIVAPDVGWVNLDSFAERLFCPTEGLQILCKPCHKLKTDSEKKIRTLVKKNAKKIKDALSKGSKN